MTDPGRVGDEPPRLGVLQPLPGQPRIDRVRVRDDRAHVVRHQDAEYPGEERPGVLAAGDDLLQRHRERQVHEHVPGKARGEHQRPQLAAPAVTGRDQPHGGPPLPWTVTTLGSLGTGGTPMVTKYQKFADGYKAEAVKLYRESNQTIAETARNLGLKESTLANWVKKDKDNEAVAVGEAPLTPAERTRIRELEADVRRLNMENAFLKKASAYFASQNL